MSSDKSLLNELRKINIALKRRMSTFVLGDRKLSAVSSMVVHYIFMQGGSAKQKDVENEFGLRRSTASQLIKKLEEDGYVTREITGNDGKSKTIYLTQEARQQQTAVAEKFGEIEKQIESSLTPNEIGSFLLLSQKICKNIEGR